MRGARIVVRAPVVRANESKTSNGLLRTVLLSSGFAALISASISFTAVVWSTRANDAAARAREHENDQRRAVFRLAGLRSTYCSAEEDYLVARWDMDKALFAIDQPNGKVNTETWWHFAQHLSDQANRVTLIQRELHECLTEVGSAFRDDDQVLRMVHGLFAASIQTDEVTANSIQLGAERAEVKRIHDRVVQVYDQPIEKLEHALDVQLGLVVIVKK